MGTFKFDEIAFNSTEKKKPVDEDKYTYLGLEHLDSDSIYVTRYGADVAPKGDKLIMKKGDVLFGKRRAYQKKVAIAPFDGIFSAHGMVLRPKEDVIDKDFFPMFIKSDYFLDAAIKISVGSLSPTINWRDLKELKFELPSLEEQRDLAEVLWAIYDMKDRYKKLILATDELVKSQFIEMFGDLYNLGGKWDSYAFVDAVEDISRKGAKIPKEEYLESGEYPIIDQGQDFIAGYTDKNEGMILETETIVFGDHTRCFKYTDFPYFMGADGVKVLKVKIDDLDYRFLLQEFKQMPIPNMGYNRHFRWLKEFKVYVPPIQLQKKYAEFIEQSDKSKFYG